MTKKIGRNEPCPCGSGKKYKRCCSPRAKKLRAQQGRRDRLAKARAEIAARVEQQDEEGEVQGEQ
jgi:hypothetical protein